MKKVRKKRKKKHRQRERNRKRKNEEFNQKYFPKNSRTFQPNGTFSAEYFRTIKLN